MKKLFFYVFVLLETISLHAQNGTGKVFSSVVPSGQTLCFELVTWYEDDTVAAVVTMPIGILNLDDTTGVWDSIPAPTGNLIIPDSIEYRNKKYVVCWISGNFDGNSLTSVHISDKIERIDARFETPNFNIYYSGSIVQWVNMDFSSYSPSWNLYLNNTLVEHLIIPEGVETINAFMGSPFMFCKSLKSVVLPHSMRDIGFATFSACVNLESVVFLSDNLSGSLGQVFLGCTRLKHVELPQWHSNTPYYIGERCFSECDSLTSIRIPDSVIIENLAFDNCPNLDTIFLGNEPPQMWTWDNYGDSFLQQFGGRENNIVFIAPCGTIDEYPAICRRKSSIIEQGQQMESCVELWNINLVESGSNHQLYLYTSDSLQGVVHADVLPSTIESSNNCIKNVMISATANNGYHFIYWSDGDTNNPRNLSLTQNTSLTAFFAKNNYWISVQSVDTNMGFVSTSDSAFFLDTIIITALAKNGYHFVQWSDGVIANPRPIIVTGDSLIVALFGINMYNVSLSVDDILSGSVQGTGLYAYNDTAIIAAIANPNHRFVQWSNGITENPYYLVVKSDTSITAIFSEHYDTLIVQVHDTTYVPIHDTAYIEVHDTSYINVHDTTYIDVYIPVHDTTIVTVIDTVYENVPFAVHDTTYINVHDTAYVDVPYAVHDTTYVNVPVHDTTYIDVYDTTYVEVNDTTYINVPYAVHDTTFIEIHDTTYAEVYVYDTTVVDNYIHDTTTVYDTVILTEYVHDTTIIAADTLYLTEYVHDTTVVDNYIYDTIVNTEYVYITDTVTNTEYVYDTIVLIQTDTVVVDNYITDTLTVTDTLVVIDYLTDTLYLWDTLYLTDTVYIHDTVYVHDSVGVDDVATVNYTVYATGSQVVVEGDFDGQVALYDVNGRVLAVKRNDLGTIRFDVAASGAYLIKVGNHPARKIVVVR